MAATRRRAEAARSSLGMLIALRRDSRPVGVAAPPCPPRRSNQPVHQIPDLLPTAA